MGVTEAVAARPHPDFLIIARTDAMPASTMDDDLEKLLAVERATVEKGKR
jgi:2-methylisocitrate lyase-like PEP mutase family enzyme